MVKIGRNDPCPCGSGKKYKKCCLGKTDAFAKPAHDLQTPPISQPFETHDDILAQRWFPEKIHAMSTESIVRKLKDFGILYDQDQFIEELKQFGSTSKVALHWEEIYPITAKGFDMDFIWMSARVLWERLAPDIVVTEALDDQMQEGYNLLEANKKIEGCRLWLEVWEHLKEQFTPDMVSIEDAEMVFEGLQSLQNWCQDLEVELGNAGRDDAMFHRKRIAYSQEFCQLFPQSDVLILQNMRRAEAEAHFALGEIEQGEARYKALIQDHPDFAWGYIGWGDMYCLFRTHEQVPLDYDKAERIYRMALEKGVVEDRDAVLERLEDLRNERKHDGDIHTEDGATLPHYDPLQAPYPEAWLALDEGERILMIEEYHEREEIELPNLKLHASFHAIIENQLADGNPIDVKTTLERLLKEGLDRHDAIHAISWVLSKPMFEAMKNPSKQTHPTESYIHDLKHLTAQKWLQYDEEE